MRWDSLLLWKTPIPPFLPPPPPRFAARLGTSSLGLRRRVTTSLHSGNPPNSQTLNADVSCLALAMPKP